MFALALPTSRSLANKIVISLVITILFARFGFAQAKKSLEFRPIARVSLQNQSFESAVVGLAKNAGVPIGIELDKSDDNLKFSIDARDSTLGAELNKLMQRHKAYEWRQIGELIDIFPKNEADSVFDVIVDHFESKNWPPIQLVQGLMRRPAIAAYLSSRRITAATWVTGAVSLEKYSVGIKGVTLREALNDVVYSTMRGWWLAFYQHKEDGNYLWFQLL